MPPTALVFAPSVLQTPTKAQAQTAGSRQAALSAGAEKKRRRQSMAEARVEQRQRAAALATAHGLTYRARGAPITEADNIAIARSLQQWDASGKATVSFVADLKSSKDRVSWASSLSGYSYDAVAAVWKALLDTHKLPEAEDTSFRGAGSPNYKQEVVITDEDKERILEFAREMLGGEDARNVTRAGLQAFMKRDLGKHVSKKRAGKLLHELSMSYGRVYRNKEANTELKTLQIRDFTVRVAEAIASGAKIGFGDETAANLHHHMDRSFRLNADPTRKHKAKGKGKRVCTTDCITEKGLLRVYDEAGKVPETRLGTGPAATSLMVFPAKSKQGNTGDYHGNFNKGIFKQYVEQRLIPAIKCSFPECTGNDGGTRFVYVVDNAPYHVFYEEDDDHFNPFDKNRATLVAKMIALGCTQLTVDHEIRAKGGAVERVEKMVVALTDEEKTKQGSNVYARIDELRAAAGAWLADHKPLMQECWLEFRFRQLGWQVLFTPPAEPDFQPIELVWAQMKAFIAATYEKGRTIEQLTQQINTALHTGDLAIPGLPGIHGGNFVRDAGAEPGANCASACAIINHVYDKVMQRFIDQPFSGMSGTVRNLTVDAAVSAAVLGCKTRAADKTRWAAALAATRANTSASAAQQHILTMNDEEFEDDIDLED